MFVERFGGRNQLTGILHPASDPSGETPAASELGVVICQPGGRDYVRAHGAARDLAMRLAALGLPTLRFDFSGVGDSIADPVEVGLDDWRRDARAAMNRLRERSGVQRIILVGCRLGALVATAVARYADDVHALVLWDPVVRGADFLASQAHVQSSALVDRRRFRRPRTDVESWESLGYACGPAMALDLEATDLPALEPQRAWVVVTAGWRDGARLRDRIETKSWVEVRDDPAWSDHRRLDEPIRCAATIPALVRAVRGAAREDA